MDFHNPVLASEILGLWGDLKNKTIVDATLGNGGHSLLLLKGGAKVVAIEADQKNAQIARERIKAEGLGDGFSLIEGNFANLELLIKNKVDGVLFDLGLSSNQLKASGRGFSFNDGESLDMRVDINNQELTAEEIINTWDFDRLYNIFTKYAQEKLSKPLILKIIRERQKSAIKTGKRLGDIIRDLYDQKKIRSQIDPATKIFMALRIEVNQEFSNLRQGLKGSLEVVKQGGVVAVITFHSGEDRIVKQFIRKEVLLGKVEIVKPETLRASQEEIKINPLSRSAVLRSFRIR